MQARFRKLSIHHHLKQAGDSLKRLNFLPSPLKISNAKITPFKASLWVVMCALVSMHVLSSCTWVAPHYESCAERLPKIVIAPVHITGTHEVPWDYGAEVTHSLIEHFSKSDLFRKDHYKGGVPSIYALPAEAKATALLWRSHYSTFQTAANKPLANGDFLLIVEIYNYQCEAMRDRRDREIKDKNLTIDARVHLIDMTHRPYSLALQEHLRIKDHRTPSQDKSGQEIHDWRSREYRHSHYGIVTSKLSQLITHKVEAAVKRAWDQRPSLANTQ